MGKYGKLAAPPERPWKIHPIWRGVGCFMIIIGPILAYVGGYVLVEMNREQRWTPMPGELMQTVRLPGFDIPVPHLYATLMIAVVLLLLGFALIITIYGLIYAIMGPPRYGPLDADPHKDVQRRPRR